MAEKLTIWAFLLGFGILGFVCQIGASYFSNLNQATLSKWSKTEYSLACELTTKRETDFTERKNSSFGKSLASFQNAEIELNDVKIKIPKFFSVDIKDVKVGGYFGFSIPTVIISLLIVFIGATDFTASDYEISV